MGKGPSYIPGLQIITVLKIKMFRVVEFFPTTKNYLKKKNTYCIGIMLPTHHQKVWHFLYINL